MYTATTYEPPQQFGSLFTDVLAGFATAAGIDVPATTEAIAQVSTGALDDTRVLQAALTTISQNEGNDAFNPQGIDGIRGANTLNAIRAFQTSRGLSPDGIVGPLTKSAIQDALLSSDVESPDQRATIIAQANGITPQQATNIVANADNQGSGAPAIPVASGNSPQPPPPTAAAPPALPQPEPTQSVPTTNVTNRTTSASSLPFGITKKQAIIGGSIVGGVLLVGVIAAAKHHATK